MTAHQRLPSLDGNGGQAKQDGKESAVLEVLPVTPDKAQDANEPEQSTENDIDSKTVVLLLLHASVDGCIVVFQQGQRQSLNGSIDGDPCFHSVPSHERRHRFGLQELGVVLEFDGFGNNVGIKGSELGGDVILPDCFFEEWNVLECQVGHGQCRLDVFRPGHRESGGRSLGDFVFGVSGNRVGVERCECFPNGFGLDLGDVVFNVHDGFGCVDPDSFDSREARELLLDRQNVRLDEHIVNVQGGPSHVGGGFLSDGTVLAHLGVKSLPVQCHGDFVCVDLLGRMLDVNHFGRNVDLDLFDSGNGFENLVDGRYLGRAANPLYIKLGFDQGRHAVAVIIGR